MTANPSTPRISVICPTYNRSRAITSTLDSVRAQSITDWELLVISDGSTDDTEDWVRRAADTDARIRLIRAERRGHPSGPRNIGLAQARGEFVAYLDHDDRWRTQHVRGLLSAFDAGADLVATGFECRDVSERVTSRSYVLELCWHPEIQLLGPVFEPSRVAHRRPLAERVGGWRSGDGLEDWDLWLRLADAGARFTTVRERTALLLDDSGTRRHRTVRRHRLPLAVFDDPRHARAVLHALRHERHEAAFRDAYLADTTAWYERMAATAEFTVPLGWKGDLATEIARVAEEPGPLWPDLVVVPGQGRFVLAQLLWCPTAEHARRIETLVRRVQLRQLALIDEIAAGCLS
ncbi:glycosyltransferase family 2 protein [Streptomyces buecherae]|uniref:glycosyltransferase family 2 protein n=1 Tax=Streptomyces buecherae TaxID=2763006 RepID=UPI00379DAA3A